MKDLSLLVWLTQLGISVAAPPVLIILLARWLQNQHGWGSWVLWAGIILGFLLAFDGLRISLKTMHLISRNKDTDQTPPVSFNDHD